MKPLPMEAIFASGKKTGRVVVVEETSYDSGIGQCIGYAFSARNLKIPVRLIDLGREFVPHGSNAALYEKYGLDATGIAKDVEVICRREK